MGWATNRSLLFCPPERVKSQCRPMVLGLAAWIHLVLKSQQTEMARLMRAKARNLDIVAQQIGFARHRIGPAGKEALLIIEARPPGKATADLQIFTQTMPDHVGRQHAFGRLLVVSTAGGVDVMIA